MLDSASYVVTDQAFGAPYIDLDEERTEPVPHRRVHGGFDRTDTRFNFYFPPAERYQGRMINPLQGGLGGADDFFGSPFGEAMGGLSMCLRLGAYMVESNQGFIGGDAVDITGDADDSLHLWRASAEVARFSKHLATQIYGAPPHHSYVFGGSGGGLRSPVCLENAPDVWDAAMPHMGGQGFQVLLFGSLCNVQRVLGDKLADVIDATAPGGSGDPFAGLDFHQREELAMLYRHGFPRGNEPMIGNSMIHMTFWTMFADILAEKDAGYFEAFWTETGYVGHDLPQLVERDLVDDRFRVARTLSARDLLEEPEFAGPEFERLRNTATRFGMYAGADMSLPVAVEVPGAGDGFRLGTTVTVTSGEAAARRLYVTWAEGDVLLCQSHGEANVKRFAGVVPGDEVHVSNRAYLAFCYYPRHHAMDNVQFDCVRVDGLPVYPQHPTDQLPLGRNRWTGRYRGKLMWVHHLQDSGVWPPLALMYGGFVESAQGPEGAAERFRLRWAHNAEHLPPMAIQGTADRASTTRLIDYQPVLEQSLADVIDWVENGNPPAPEPYHYEGADGLVSFPATAAERGGIQAVVTVTANGGTRADVGVGEPVQLEVRAEVPPGAGTVVDVQWDFDGSGSFPYRHDHVDGTQSDVKLTTTHTYDRPGTYFVTAQVRSHREGDVNATARRIPNFGHARVVVA